MSRPRRCFCCGERADGGETGVYVMSNDKTRWQCFCEKHANEGGPDLSNPVFQSVGTWNRWKKRHPVLSERIEKPSIMGKGGIASKGKGNCWGPSFA